MMFRAMMLVSGSQNGYPLLPLQHWRISRIIQENSKFSKFSLKSDCNRSVTLSGTDEKIIVIHPMRCAAKEYEEEPSRRLEEPTSADDDYNPRRLETVWRRSFPSTHTEQTARQAHGKRENRRARLTIFYTAAAAAARTLVNRTESSSRERTSVSTRKSIYIKTFCHASRQLVFRAVATPPLGIVIRKIDDLWWIPCRSDYLIHFYSLLLRIG